MFRGSCATAGRRLNGSEKSNGGEDCGEMSNGSDDGVEEEGGGSSETSIRSYHSVSG